MLLGEEISV